MAHFLSREVFNVEANQRFKIGRFEYILGGEIGDGAVGIVRKATRIDNGELRAVKFLAPDPKYIDENIFDDVAARFKREGERGVRLRHPHLITIEGCSENEPGSAFEGNGPKNPMLVMEFIHGTTLESYIRDTIRMERVESLIFRNWVTIGNYKVLLIYRLC